MTPWGRRAVRVPVVPAVPAAAQGGAARVGRQEEEGGGKRVCSFKSLPGRAQHARLPDDRAVATPAPCRHLKGSGGRARGGAGSGAGPEPEPEGRSEGSAIRSSGLLGWPPRAALPSCGRRQAIGRVWVQAGGYRAHQALSAPAAR